MALTQKRIDEMLDEFAELEDDEFDAWIEAQPDAHELGMELLDLMRSPEPSPKPKRKRD